MKNNLFVVLLLSVFACASSDEKENQAFDDFQLLDNEKHDRLLEDCKCQGSTTIYDLKANTWSSTDSVDASYATLPASTFKIINTLIALETEVVKDENEIVPWPGGTDTTKYGFRPGIYHDMGMKEAFKLSAVWVYVELAAKIGKGKYKEMLGKASYGNVDVSIDDPDFWNFGNFAISPINQIEILKGIYEETLDFKKSSFGVLKGMMIEEETQNYILRAKTGWTRDGGKDTGWWVGYVENNENVYFFATRLIKDREIKTSNFGSCRKNITKNILSNLNII